MGQRTRSQKRRERQRRKEYEAESPALGGFVWQAILISLLGCLFCAGKDWEEKVEKAKVSSSPDDADEGDGGDRRHHHQRRGRDRRSRSLSDSGSIEGGYRDYRNGASEGNGIAYVGSDRYGRVSRDDRIAYIPGGGGRHRGYVEEVYEEEESPAPRRRRVRRGESLD